MASQYGLSLDSPVVALDVPYPVDALREPLEAAMHLEDLILFLPTIDTSDNIIDCLHWACLEFFKTNYPYHHVAPLFVVGAVPHMPLLGLLWARVLCELYRGYCPP